jgi:hypothetical protein
MATAAATGNGRISRLPSLTPGSRGRRRGLGGPGVRRWKPGGSHALFPRELRPGRTRLTREPSRAVDRQTHEDHSLNRRQEPGHATSSHRLALSSRYRGSPGFGRLCRYPARIGSGPNHGATALDLPKAFARTWQSRSAKWVARKPNEFALTSYLYLEQHEGRYASLTSMDSTSDSLAPCASRSTSRRPSLSCVAFPRIQLLVAPPWLAVTGSVRPATSNAILLRP